MNFRIKLTRKYLAVAAGALLAVGCGLLLHEYPLGNGLAHLSYDLLMVVRGDVRVDEARIVYMDEISHEKLNQSLNAAWDRSIHARLIDRLTAAGARAIVFDVTFTDPNRDNPAADQLLAKAMKQSGRVFVAADTVRSGFKAKKIEPPFELVRDAATEFGSDELLPDADLVVRRHTPKGDAPLSSLSWLVAGFCGAPAAKQEGSEDLLRWMNYYGSPNFIPWKSYFKALDASEVPDEFFRNKVVFVGARILTRFAGERKDEYRNPYSFWLSEKMKTEQEALYMPGVEVQATAFLNLLRGDWLRRFSGSAETLVVIGLGLLFGYGLVRFHPVLATSIALGGLVLVAGACYLLFSRKLIWFPWLIIVVQISVALFWSILYNSIQLYVERRLYEQTLRLYLPPKLVKKFAKSRELIKHGGQNETLTLLFSDIANFTTITEGIGPHELEKMMRQYFQMAVKECIHKADGTVSKFIGDAIFAFWNAPDAQVDHALLGCQAALLFRDQAAKPIHGRLLATRIGLHTGEASVGNFGSDDRYDYTALGENVNLASRLEGLNKHVGTFCLISGETKKAIGDRLVTRSLGKFQLKGFEGLVDVHELIGQPDHAEIAREWREAFAEALTNYEQRNLEFAEIGFRRVLELRMEDGPSKFYLERIAELSRQQLPENWVTHTVLKEK